MANVFSRPNTNGFKGYALLEPVLVLVGGLLMPVMRQRLTLVSPAENLLVIDEGLPLNTFAKKIASHQLKSMQHVGYLIRFFPGENDVVITWETVGCSVPIGSLVFNAEELLQQIAPDEVNAYLKSRNKKS